MKESAGMTWAAELGLPDRDDSTAVIHLCTPFLPQPKRRARHNVPLLKARFPALDPTPGRTKGAARINLASYRYLGAPSRTCGQRSDSTARTSSMTSH